MTSKAEKLACEICIRGHRVAKCQHTDRPLLRVSRKGRPVSQCNHCRDLRNSRSVHTKCKCASASHQAMLKQFGQERCCCGEGHTCTCAHKTERKPTNGIHSPRSVDKSSTLSTIMSPPKSEHRTTEIAPALTSSGCAQSSAPNDDRADAINAVPSLSAGGLNDWHSGDTLNSWNIPFEGPLPDNSLEDLQGLTGNWDSIPNVGPNEQAYMTMPTFDDPLSTVDSFDLGSLFNETDIGQIPMLDNLDLLDCTTMDFYDPKQLLRQP